MILKGSRLELRGKILAMSAHAWARKELKKGKVRHEPELSDGERLRLGKNESKALCEIFHKRALPPIRRPTKTGLAFAAAVSFSRLRARILTNTPLSLQEQKLALSADRERFDHHQIRPLLREFLPVRPAGEHEIDIARKIFQNRRVPEWCAQIKEYRKKTGIIQDQLGPGRQGSIDRAGEWAKVFAPTQGGHDRTRIERDRAGQQPG